MPPPNTGVTITWGTSTGAPRPDTTTINPARKEQVTTDPTTNSRREPRQEQLPLSAVTMMRPAAARSRTFGRYAVGLRPIPDSAASTERAQNTTKNKKRDDRTPSKRS